MDETPTPHPLRARVLAELHARPFAPIETLGRVFHYAFASDAEAAAADRAALAAFCAARGLPAPPSHARHARFALGRAILRWEGHGEFTTYSWELAGAGNGAAAPFHPAAAELGAPMRALPQPGPLLVALDLALRPAASLPEGPVSVFGEERTVAAEVEDGAAVVATDFQPDAGGFVRMLVLDHGLGPARAGALTRRLIEIETYRTLALLGLPEAQDLAPTLRRTEIELPRLLHAMQGREGVDANHALLDRITILAAELEAGAAGSLYRFGATRAYDEFVRLRLADLRERPLPGLPSWSAFLARRLSPAMRTCAATEERQANLSAKLARAAQLLRARVEVDLERQNSALLGAMNERARVQLRLQHTVEGLSVAAIAYYVTSLAHLAFEGAHGAGLALDPAVATAAVVPLAVLGVALVVRRIRRGHGDA